MFESHITIEPIEHNTFVKLCKSLKVKPVIIINDSGSNEPIQMMTAKFHNTDNIDIALSDMSFLSDQLVYALRDSRVIRRKLERIIKKKDKPTDCLYFEFHTKFRIYKEYITKFKSIVNECGGHTALNRLKYHDATGEYMIFATARDESIMKNIVGATRKWAAPIQTIRECVVYDDNPGIDSGWNECASCLMKRVDLDREIL